MQAAEGVYFFVMNYFAHAYRFLDDPYFAAGTGVPDWLSVADRQVRVRLARVEAFLKEAEPQAAAVARGVAQHLRDDARFHETRAFAETCYRLTATVRDVLGGERGFRPAFLGHLLLEVLLDSSLIAEDPGRLETYYRVLDGVDALAVQAVVNRLANCPTERLAPMIELFRVERILCDYAEDARLLVRLNQVMHRVGLDPLPEHFPEVLPEARRLVESRKAELLDGM